MTEEASNQSPFNFATKVQGISNMNTQSSTPAQSRPQSTTSKTNDNNIQSLNGRSRANSAYQNADQNFSTLSTQSIENFFVNPYDSNNPNSKPGYYNTLSSAFAGPFSKGLQSKQFQQNNENMLDLQQRSVRFGPNSQNPSQDLNFMNTDRSLNFDLVGSQYSGTLQQSLGNTNSGQYLVQDVNQPQPPMQETIQEVDNSLNQSLAQESIKATPNTELQTPENQEKQAKKTVSIKESLLQGPKYGTQGVKSLKENKQGNQLSKFFRKLSAKPSKADEQIETIEPNSEIDVFENSYIDQQKESQSSDKFISKRSKKIQEHSTSLKMSSLFSTASRDVNKNKEKAVQDQQQDKSTDKVQVSIEDQQAVQQVEIENDKENLENSENQQAPQEDQQQNQQQQQQSKKYGLSFQMLDSKNRANSKKLQSRGSQELPKKDKNGDIKTKDKVKESTTSDDKSSKEEKVNIVDGRKQSAALGLFRQGGMETQSLQRLSVQKVKRKRKKQISLYLRGFGNNNSNNSNSNDAKLERQISDGLVGAPPGQIGLLNNGNTCFMNAAFQCLRCTPNLVHLLMDELKIVDMQQTQQIQEPNSKDEVEINYKKMVNNTLENAHSGPLIVTSKNMQQLGDDPQSDEPPKPPSPTAKGGTDSDDDKIKAYVPVQEGDEQVGVFKEGQRQYSKSATINSDTQKVPLNMNNRRNFFSSQYSFLQNGKGSKLDQQLVDQINLKGTLNGGDMKFYTPNARQEHLQKILYDAELKQQYQTLQAQKENESLKFQYNVDTTNDQSSSQNIDTQMQDWQSRIQNLTNFQQFPRIQRSWSDITLQLPYREHVGVVPQSLFSQPYPPLLSQRSSLGVDSSRHSGIRKENSLQSQASNLTSLSNLASLKQPLATPEKSQKLEKKKTLGKASSLFSFGRRSKDSVVNDSYKDRSGSNTARTTDMELMKPDIPVAPQLPTCDPSKLQQFKQNPVAQIDTFFLETDLSKIQKQNKNQELNLNYAALNMPKEGVQQSSSTECSSNENSQSNNAQQNNTVDNQQQNGQGQVTQAQDQKVQNAVKDRSIAEVSVELMQKLVLENANSTVNLLDLQLQLQKQPLGKELCDGGQHDSQEFLKILLNCIHTDLKSFKQKETPQQVQLHQESLKAEIRKQKAQKEKIYEEEVTVNDISTLAQPQHTTVTSEQTQTQQAPQQIQVQQVQTQGYKNGKQTLQQVLQMRNRFDSENDSNKDSDEDTNGDEDIGNTIQSNIELDTYSQMKQLVQQETQRKFEGIDMEQLQEGSSPKTSQHESNNSTADKIGQIQPQNQSQGSVQEQGQQNKANESMNKWSEYVKGEDSIITDIFSGQLQSSVRCHACGTKTNMYEIFQELILPIQREKKGLWNPLKPSITLEELLRVFTAEEEMKGKEAFYCETCKSKQTATKQMLISRFPKVLIVQLLRSRDRLNTQVNFPIKNLSLDQFAASKSDDVQNSALNTESEQAPNATRGKTKDGKAALSARNNKQNKNNESITQQNKDLSSTTESNATKYELYGVINHFGSMSQGHYTSQCRIKTAQEKEEWYLFNDGIVSKTNQDKIVTSNAYMLFYVSKEYVYENKKHVVSKDQQKFQQMQQDLQSKIFGTETSQGQ